jgi:serine/threonine protein kinase
VLEVHSELLTFARHHRVRGPARGDLVTIGEARGNLGGFGAVHPVRAVAATAPSRPLLAKIFRADAVKGSGGKEKIIRGVERLHDVLDRRSSHDWIEALLAVPFSIATASHEGRKHLVLFMLDLEPLGYRPAPLNSDDELDSYVQRDDADRFDLAFRYTQRAALLEDIDFVHADQNPENLMFDLQALDVQIIDFDAGTIVRDGDERPLTPGKPDDFMPPEVKGEGLELPSTDHYTRATERWSIGSLVGVLIFGLHPGFFLSSLSSSSLERYRRAHRWPEIDPDGNLFGDPQNKDSYREFCQGLTNMPDRLIELFVQLFAAGIDAEQRPTAHDWQRCIEACRTPPIVEELTVEPDFVVEGTEVLVSWEIEQAERVECPQLGTPLPASGSRHVVVHESTSFAFTAINRYGQTRAFSPLVRTVPLPRLESIPLAAFPGFEFHTSIPMPPSPVQSDPFPLAPSLDRFFSANIAPATYTATAIPTMPQIPDLFALDLEPQWPEHSPRALLNTDWFR